MRVLTAVPCRTAQVGRWLLPAALVAPLLSAASSVHAATVSVIVDGVVPSPSRVFASLCAGGLEPTNCLTGQTAPASATRLRFTFPDVEPGLYAVAVFEDVNGNGVLDRSRNGLPLEPYGFSNGAGRTGAPRFERAAVQVIGDTQIGIRLTTLVGR